MKKTVFWIISLCFFQSLCALTEVISPVLAKEPTSTATDCSYSRDEMLSLDQNAFDQDLKGGWHGVANRDGCLEVAADLIRDYREVNGLESTTLYWHEGEVRAWGGATDEAIALMEKSYHVDGNPFGWNEYVDATIAFLKQDMDGLIKAREAILQIPRHPDFPVERLWPPNIKFIDAFIECFGQEYKDSYGRCEH